LYEYVLVIKDYLSHDVVLGITNVLMRVTMKLEKKSSSRSSVGETKLLLDYLSYLLLSTMAMMITTTATTPIIPPIRSQSIAAGGVQLMAFRMRLYPSIVTS